jgi:hypothetical protein
MPKYSLNIVIFIEVVVFALASFYARQMLDTITAAQQFSPLLVLLLKGVLLAGMVGLAVFTHTQIVRFLRSRGMEG